MAKKEKPSDGDVEQRLFRVRPTKQARKDCDDLLESKREALGVISQLKLLRHWPLNEKQQEKLGSDLDFSKVHHNGETFYELRLDDEHLHMKNLRVFFWINDKRNTIWIMHGYWKKVQRLENTVKTLVARRIKSLKGEMQDGSVK